MKRKSNNILPYILLVMTALFTACINKQEGHNHSVEHSNNSTDILAQTISPNKLVLSNQATVKVQLSGSGGKTEKAQGYISPDQNRNQSVAARFGGRIEKLYIKFSNQYVNTGDKIMDLYSPGLRTIQEEHLFLLKSNAENSLLENSREKLHLLGITKNQITQLEKNGTVALTIAVYSPASGYAFLSAQSGQVNNSSQNTSTANTMSMQQAVEKENSTAAQASQIREGSYITEGQTLFNINDLQEVWALISVDNQNIHKIHKNQAVEIVSESNSSKIIKGEVALIEQTFEEANQRFSRVRIVLSNPNNSLKVNSLVTAQFTLIDTNNLQVPTSAVFKTGLNAYVWVKTDTTQNGTGIFQLRKIIAGASNNGMTIINGGLSPHEEIAKQAGLMTDSETLLNAN